MLPIREHFAEEYRSTTVDGFDMDTEGNHPEGWRYVKTLSKDILEELEPSALTEIVSVGEKGEHNVPGLSRAQRRALSRTSNSQMNSGGVNR